MAMAILATPMLPEPIISTARGRLRPSLRLRLMLTTDTPMLLPMLDTMAMLPTPMLTTESPTATARGRLRPSLRLMAMASDPPTDTDTHMLVPMPTVAMAVDTTG